MPWTFAVTSDLYLKLPKFSSFSKRDDVRISSPNLGRDNMVFMTLWNSWAQRKALTEINKIDFRVVWSCSRVQCTRHGFTHPTVGRKWKGLSLLCNWMSAILCSERGATPLLQGGFYYSILQLKKKKKVIISSVFGLGLADNLSAGISEFVKAWLSFHCS